MLWDVSIPSYHSLMHDDSMWYVEVTEVLHKRRLQQESAEGGRRPIHCECLTCIWALGNNEFEHANALTDSKLEKIDDAHA